MRAIHIFHAPRRRLRAQMFPQRSLTTPSQALASLTPPRRQIIAPIMPQTALHRTFSTTLPLQKQKHRAPKRDTRITMIRYFLYHPKNPRPLRFSRNRSLRHWTIHRAWQLFRAKQRQKRETDLMRQYQCMKEACEALRLTGEDGLAVLYGAKSSQLPEGAKDRQSVRLEVPSSAQDGQGQKQVVELDIAAAAERQKDVGKLYRVAMNKRGIFDGLPIEYARAQVDTPSKSGWNHDWTR